MWDAIALHTERSIAWCKESEVAVMSKGIGIDFSGPGNGLTMAKYQAVVEEYSKADFKAGVNQTLCWLCSTKPTTTWGEYCLLLLTA